MRLQIVQEALKKKNIKYEYTEIDGCGSLDFLFRGLKFHVWEYEDRIITRVEAENLIRTALRNRLSKRKSAMKM